MNARRRAGLHGGHSRLGRYACKRAQAGMVIVEFALIVPIIFSLVIATFLLGSLFWQYSALLKANNAAARYLSRIPAVEMSSVTKWEDARKTAIDILDAGAEGAGITGHSYEFSCNPACGAGTVAPLPTTIKIGLWNYAFGGGPGDFGYQWYGDYVQVKTEVTVRYAN